MGVIYLLPIYELIPAPPEKQRFEYHIAPLEAQSGMAGEGKLAQSFMPQVDFTLTNIIIPIGRTQPYTDGIWHVELRIDEGGHPSEEVLAEANFEVAILPLEGYSWIGLDMGEVPLLRDVSSWIAQYRTNYSQWWSTPHILSDGGNLYPRGEALVMSRGTTKWVGYGEGLDLGFVTWGYQ